MADTLFAKIVRKEIPPTSYTKTTCVSGSRM